MSFDLPANIQRDLERYAMAEHISPTEAAVKFIQSGLQAQGRRSKNVAPLTDSELQYLDQTFPALGAMDDITETEWKRIEKGVARVKRAGLSTRA